VEDTFRWWEGEGADGDLIREEGGPWRRES